MILTPWITGIKKNFHIWAPALLFLALCFYCFRFFVDDTYINFIAAKNLIEFGKLSANLHHNVNPTTANFHMIFSAIVYAVAGQDYLEPILKIIGIFVGIGTLFLLNATLDRMEVDKAFRFFANIYLASSFPFILWTASAMDTVFDTATIMLCFFFWFQDLKVETVRRNLLFTLFLLVLSRLDFALLSVIILTSLVWQLGISRSLMKQIALYFALPLALMMVGLKNYYGTIVPTPIIKASLGLEGMVQNFLNFGGLYFLHFCRLNFNFLSVLSVAAITIQSLKRIRSPLRNQFDFQFLTAAAAVSAYVMYIISQGNVHMMFAFRFYTPLLAPLALFLGYAAFRFRNFLKLNSIRTLSAVIAIILSVNTATFFYGYYKNLNFSQIPGGDFTGMKNNHIKGWIELHEGMRHAGIYFGSILPPGSKVFLGVAGIIPYFMNKLAYDNGLLGSPEVWQFDYVLNGCDSVRPVPKGFIRHEYKPVSEDTLYYPNSSWCIRQLMSSNQPRLNTEHNGDRLSQLPIYDIKGFEGILDMAGDFDARFLVETKQWDEFVEHLNKLNSLSDTTTGRRELTGYGQYLPDEYRHKLIIPTDKTKTEK